MIESYGDKNTKLVTELTFYHWSMH